MVESQKRGFTFIGTRYTSLPNQLRLCNRTVSVSYPNDQTIMGDVINIFLDDEYGLRSLQFPIRTIVDIGANIGLFSLWARHNFPNATIHAYEPNLEALSYATA